MASPENVNLPHAFEERIKSQLGDSYPDFIRSLHKPAITSVRINERKRVNKNAAHPIPWCDTGFYLDQRPVFTLDPSFHAGAYYVQEASSMFLEQAFQQCIDLSKKINVLDLCAAPGGKSTHIASLISTDSLLVSNEVINTRASILSENIQKWGSSNNVVTNSDPEVFSDLPGLFDVIVVDAPCSGEGLFRKDPSAIKEWSPENVVLCAGRQRRIVGDAWPALKEGGVLVYSTCTYSEQENEENLQWLRDQHDVEFLSIKLDPAWGVQEIDRDRIKGYRFFPHLINGEGFFLSVIRKLESSKTQSLRKSRNVFQSPSKSLIESVSSWMTAPEQKHFIIRESMIQSFQEVNFPTIELLTQKLHIKSAGTFIATVKHNKLIPEHNLALSLDLNRENFIKIDLNKEEAIQYLKKETISLSSYQKGFALITYENVPLGWANVLENRMNNMYPSQWRIRMS